MICIFQSSLISQVHDYCPKAKKIGHPIVGDFTYDDDRHSPRMYLHACRLIIQGEEEEEGGCSGRRRKKSNKKRQGEVMSSSKSPMINVDDWATFEKCLKGVWKEETRVQDARDMLESLSS